MLRTGWNVRCSTGGSIDAAAREVWDDDVVGCFYCVRIRISDGWFERGAGRAVGSPLVVYLNIMAGAYRGARIRSS